MPTSQVIYCCITNQGKICIRAGGEVDDRGWDVWMASPTQWTWVWVDSGSWWWTGRSGVLQFMGLQRVGHEWATELNWTPGYLDLSLVCSHWLLDLYTLVCFTFQEHPLSFTLRLLLQDPVPACLSSDSSCLLVKFSLLSKSWYHDASQKTATTACVS